MPIIPADPKKLIEANTTGVDASLPAVADIAVEGGALVVTTHDEFVRDPKPAAPIVAYSLKTALSDFPHNQPAIFAMYARAIEDSPELSHELLGTINLSWFANLDASKNEWIKLGQAIHRIKSENIETTYTGDHDDLPKSSLNIKNPASFDADMRTLVSHLGDDLKIVTDTLTALVRIAPVTEFYLNLVNWAKPENSKWLIGSLLYIKPELAKKYMGSLDWTQADPISSLISFYLEQPDNQVAKDQLTQLVDVDKSEKAVSLLLQTTRAGLYVQYGMYDGDPCLEFVESLSPFLPTLLQAKPDFGDELVDFAQRAMDEFGSSPYTRARAESVLRAILPAVMLANPEHFDKMLEANNELTKIVIDIVADSSNYALTDLVIALAKNADPKQAQAGATILGILSNASAKAKEVLIQMAIEFKGSADKNFYLASFDPKEKHVANDARLVWLWMDYIRRPGVGYGDKHYPITELLDSPFVQVSDKQLMVKAHFAQLMPNYVDQVLKVADLGIRQRFLSHYYRDNAQDESKIGKVRSYFIRTFRPDEPFIKELFLEELHKPNPNPEIVAVLKKHKDYPHQIKLAWRLYELRQASPENLPAVAAKLLTLDKGDFEIVFNGAAPTQSFASLVAGMATLFAANGFVGIPDLLVEALKAVRVSPEHKTFYGLLDFAAKNHPHEPTRLVLTGVKVAQDQLSLTSSGKGNGPGTTAIDDGFNPALYGGQAFVGMPAPSAFVRMAL